MRSVTLKPPTTLQRLVSPTVLLEAVTSGLPVIAPKLSGIKEFIKEDTGFLPKPCGAVDEYISYLRRKSDYRIVRTKAASAKAFGPIYLQPRQSTRLFCLLICYDSSNAEKKLRPTRATLQQCEPSPGKVN